MMLSENLKDTEMSDELTPIHWELPKGPAVPLFLYSQEATGEYLVSHKAVFDVWASFLLWSYCFH